MMRCPRCRRELVELETAQEKCPYCGERLADMSAPSDPSSAADDGMGTVDSTPFLSSRKPSDSDEGTNQQDHAATVDSSTFQLRGEETPDSTDSKGESSAGPLDFTTTVDSAPPDLPDSAKIDALWSGVSAPSPTVTIRTGEPGSTQSTLSLLIREHAMGPADPDVADSLDYDLNDPIGEGGMGIVYSARQSSLDRDVAVKMLKPRLMSDQDQCQKFLSEAVVTSELEHPGIIPIYDLGRKHDGTLFYSMKRVHGTPWSAVIHKHALNENIEILLKVCDAIAFAHSRDVIHRDLKPDNIMIGEFGEVLVLDWGLAVSVAEQSESAKIARVTAMGGTPAYMAPELATGPPERIGKQSDVYLLGAILYECITGKLPRRQSDVTACLVAAAQNQIEPTDKQGELVDIALKAMAKDPDDRYQDVRAFQIAIREYQSHAESITLTDRANDDLHAACKSGENRDFARALFGFEEALELWPENRRARIGLDEANMAYAASAYEKGDFDLGLSLLDEHRSAHRELHDKLISAQGERAARLQRLRTARRIMVALVALVVLATTTGIVLVWIAKQEAEVQRDIAKQQKQVAIVQKQIASENEQRARQQKGIADEQRQVALRNEKEANRQRQVALKNEKEAVEQREKAQYEAYIAMIGLADVKIQERAFDQALALLRNCKPSLRNWEWGRLMYYCRPGNVDTLVAGHRLESVAWNAAGDRVAAAGLDGVTRVWDATSGRLLGELPQGGRQTYALAVAFSPVDSDLLAVGTNLPDHLLKIWNMATGRQRSLVGHESDVVSLEFTHDGRQLLSASKDHTAGLWDVESGELIRRFRGHDWWVWDASFSPDEKRVVTASEDGTARIWDVQTGLQRMNQRGEPTPFTGHHGAVFAAAFSPDGQIVATGGFDKHVLLWKPDELIAFDFTKMIDDQPVPKQSFQTLDKHTAPVHSVAFASDGQFLVTGSSDNSVIVWSARNQTLNDHPMARGALWKILQGHSSLVRKAVFSPTDENRVASASYDGTVRIWNVRDYSQQQTISGTVLRGHADAILSADFSPTGDYVITASRDRTAMSWSPSTGHQVKQFRQGHRFLVSDGAFYPNGRRLITVAGDGTARVWDIQRGSELFVLQGIGYTAAMALSPDGRWIVTAKSDRSSDSKDGQQKEGRPAIAADRAAATIWDAETGSPIRDLAGHAAPVTAIAVSCDSKIAFTGDAKGRGCLWDIKTGKQRSVLRWHTGKITDAAFTRDGKILLTASDDKTVCQWALDDTQPRPLDTLVLKHGDGVRSLDITADDRWVMTGDKDGRVHLWNRRNGREVWSRRPVGEGDVTSVAIAPDATTGLFVVASKDSAIKTIFVCSPLLDPTEVHQFHQFEAQDVWAAIFSPDGQSIVSFGGDQASLWDRRGQLMMQFSPHRTVSFASYSPDARRVVTAGWDATARIWDTATGKALLTLTDHGGDKLTGHTGRINSALFSMDGKRVLTASEDGTIKIWDAETGAVLRTFRGHSAGVEYAMFSPDGLHVLSASRDHTACIWNLETGEQQRRFVGHTLAVWRAAYSADGRQVVTGSEDRLAKIWDVDTGKELRTLVGHTAGVRAVTFSPDGKRILTGSADRTAKLWDASNAKEILTLKEHRQAVTSVAFSRNGLNALTGSLDGTAVIWPARKWSTDGVADLQETR